MNKTKVKLYPSENVIEDFMKPWLVRVNTG